MYLYPESKIAYDEEEMGEKKSIILLVCVVVLVMFKTDPLYGEIVATQSLRSSAIEISLFAFAWESSFESNPGP